MAHLSDDELKALKGRVATAMGTGANIARSNEFMLQLIREVEEHRAAANKPKSRIGVLKVGEMDVKRAETAPPAAAAPPPVPEPEADPEPPPPPASEKTLTSGKGGKKGGGKKKG